MIKKGDNQMAKQERKIIKETKYYEVYKAVSIIDDN